MNADKRKFDVVQTLEGKSPLEVFRNYQQALTAAGLQVRLLYQKACEDIYRTWAYRDDPIKPLEGMRWAGGSLPGTGIGHKDALSDRDGAMIVGGLRNPASGSRLELLLYVSESQARPDNTYPAIFVQFIELKAMTTSQVSVDAAALGQV